MTTTQINIDYTDGAPLAPDDPRGAMARSVQAARTIIGEVSETNAVNATPCSEWNALELARHIIAVLDRAAAGPSGQVINDLPILADVPVAGLADAVMTSAQHLHASWSSDETMQTSITVPWGTFPAPQVIGAYAAETLVHAWDLAVAIGVDVNWPDADAAAHFEMLKAGIPEEGRGEFMPFDPVVRPGDDAPMIEHLVGWQGRVVENWRVSA